jgi:uncharacterized protein YcaQ
MTVHISREQARRFLVAYHFAPTDIPGVFARLGTVQYDPINPVGRNPDLVLQARVPGYRVDDWQAMAYQDRLIYDAWDKQSSPPKYRSTRSTRLSTVSESIQSA